MSGEFGNGANRPQHDGGSGPAGAAGPSWAVPSGDDRGAAAPTHGGPSWAVPDPGPRPAPGTGGPWSNPPGRGDAWATPPPGGGFGGPLGSMGPMGAPGMGGGWGAGPGMGPGMGMPGGAESAQLRAAIARGREDANKMIVTGVGLIGLAALITIGTFVLAPGGFFFVAFGPVIYGFQKISAGRSHLERVKRLERQSQFGPPANPWGGNPPMGPGSMGPGQPRGWG